MKAFTIMLMEVLLAQKNAGSLKITLRKIMKMIMITEKQAIQPGKKEKKMFEQEPWWQTVLAGISTIGICAGLLLLLAIL